jgi:aerobic-type carbon monoxide dehydrogenase small subunit (CoxS/CutS family)
MPAYEITVNGRPERVLARPETPLLWVLRDHLGLTGTKFGCGVGVCGACTVHVDGRAVRSCQLPVADVKDQRVVTIEGLAPDLRHPLQRAWLEEDVAQCGYCQAGMILAAAALLRDKPHPTDEDVDAALSGSVCRCGTYPGIRRAIRRASGGGGR